MKPLIHQQRKMHSSLYLKCSVALLLLFLSVVIVACGDNNSGGSNTTTNAATMTIRMNDGNNSPTPGLSKYWCGAWTTQSTLPIYAKTIGVYAKFTQNINNNAVGIGDATATATVKWPDGESATMTQRTTADGLAVFSVPLTNASGLNKITLVTVSFQKDNISCNVDDARAAFFVLLPVTPTITLTAIPSATMTPGAGTATPATTTPTPNQTPTMTPDPKVTPIP